MKLLNEKMIAKVIHCIVTFFSEYSYCMLRLSPNNE